MYESTEQKVARRSIVNSTEDDEDQIVQKIWNTYRNTFLSDAFLAKEKELNEEKHFAAIISAGECRHFHAGFDYEKFPFLYPNKCDPPLTRRGILQAEATGDFLNDYFIEENYHFDKVIIECGPFLRSMMTAGQLASEIGVKEVTINYRASEVLVEMFRENPMPKLQFTKYGFDFERMKTEKIEFQSESCFPDGVHFGEPAAPADYKKQIFEMQQPEGTKQAM